MRSVRLSPELNDRVRRAAETEGVTVSEFLRAAAADRAERTLSRRNTDQLADVIGSVRGAGAGRARDTGTAFGELLDERRTAR